MGAQKISIIRFKALFVREEKYHRKKKSYSEAKFSSFSRTFTWSFLREVWNRIANTFFSTFPDQNLLCGNGSFHPFAKLSSGRSASGQRRFENLAER